MPGLQIYSTWTLVAADPPKCNQWLNNRVCVCVSSLKVCQCTHESSFEFWTIIERHIRPIKETAKEFDNGENMNEWKCCLWKWQTKSHPNFQDIGKLLPFKLLLSLVVHTVHLSFSFFSWQQSLSSSMTTKGRLMATDAKKDLKCFLLALGKMDTQDFRVKTLAIWAAFKHCNAPPTPSMKRTVFF